MSKIDEILLIEDSETCAFLNKRIIDGMNICESLVIKTNGQNALDYLISQDKNGISPPELIFLDLKMPVMDGFDFLREFRKLMPKNKPPAIVVLSSSDLKSDINKTAELGVDLYLTKNLDSYKVNQAIRKIRTTAIYSDKKYHVLAVDNNEINNTIVSH